MTSRSPTFGTLQTFIFIPRKSYETVWFRVSPAIPQKFHAFPTAIQADNASFPNTPRAKAWKILVFIKFLLAASPSQHTATLRFSFSLCLTSKSTWAYSISIPSHENRPFRCLLMLWWLLLLLAVPYPSTASVIFLGSSLGSHSCAFASSRHEICTISPRRAALLSRKL